MVPPKGKYASMTRQHDATRHRVLASGRASCINTTISTPTNKPRVTKSTRPMTKAHRPLGRPFKSPAQSTTPSQPAFQEIRAAQAGASATPEFPTPPPPRSLSMLEALPVEVIESVFLYSLNLNFPLASPVLAAAISRDHIYNILTILAFWNDEPIFPGSRAIDRILAPLRYVPLSAEEKEQLQQAVFRCRWLTMERMRAQIPTIMILSIHRYWINLGIKMDAQNTQRLERFLKRQDDSVTTFEGQGPPLDVGPPLAAPVKVLSLFRIPGPHKYRLVVRPMVMVEVRSMTLHMVLTRPGLSIFKFPDHLLRGRATGFTADDVMFLEMLRLCSNNSLCGPPSVLTSTRSTLNRTALHQGVRKAIESQNYNALVSLLKLDEFTFRFYAPNKHYHQLYTIPSDHFIAVTRVGRDKPQLNIAFFEALLRASAESIPADAPEILQWTLENVRLAEHSPSDEHEINGRLGRWLADFLLILPDLQQNPRGALETQLFIYGGLNDTPQASQFRREVLDPRRQPFQNWMPQSQFCTSAWWVKKDEQSKD
ncbi:hypothetical protein POX_f07644 [Penicillium oxalicum]|uniref:hypothetical protein n=1 Tax=Penicillium oxalicum TaxID=69781 RepID=UPI0020B8921E|nr:hypothetical protein POX_f07644 [Penicillium oxalicum]KAI2787281.1 hypothetical protein POX_f07644 [Penicillium oxalicum]